ncbi:RsmE family RNA methyltransferase [Flavitalea flava]
MALPCFYLSPDNIVAPGSGSVKEEMVLNEETSRHILQVLRMKPGELLQLTDGRGNLLTASIVDDHKKKCLVRIQSTVYHPMRERKVSIGISLVKNASRFEWFLEKATEIGVTEIIPLLCERTEKQHFRQDRMENILVSAMLQSQQTWLPVLQPQITFSQVIEIAGHGQLFIAHCLEEEKISLTDAMTSAASNAEGVQPENDDDTIVSSQLILIGPEGDFSGTEIALARQHGFIPVTLGGSRLRTETAGMVAAALLCIG